MKDENGSPKLSSGVSVSRKIGLPNYGNAEVSLWLSGLTKDTTDAEIDEALDATKIVYLKIAERIKAKINEIKAGEVLG